MPGSGVVALTLKDLKYVIFESPLPSSDFPHGMVWEPVERERKMVPEVVSLGVAAQVDQPQT